MTFEHNWVQDYISDLHDQWVNCIECLIVDPRITREEKRKLSRYLSEEDRAWKGKFCFFDEEFEEQSSLLRAMEEIDDID